MDIVVRTPHGDADVSITSRTQATTLGEVVSAVTGQAVPRLLMIDDRPVDAAVVLDDAGLLLGSVVATEPPVPLATSEAGVEIAQIAGHGAGRTTRLGPGRYRIGPGRRSGAHELESAPVDRTVFELVVEPREPSPEVTVVPDAAEVALDGTLLSESTPWRHETLTIGSRAFHLDTPARSLPERTLAAPDRDGTVTFNRPPRRPSAAPRWPVVDAVRDATSAAPTLWERRPDHDDAFVMPIGVDVADTRVVTAELAVSRALAVTGSERFRRGLVRTLIVEATTLHGPADLDLVVLTDPDRLEQWDWAKWLPHLRLDGSPAIWASRHDVSRWIGRLRPGTTPPNPARRSLVILDDPGLWNRRDAPARPLVSNPPDHVRLIVLCDDVDHVPAICTASITQESGDLARLHSFTLTETAGGNGGDEQIIRPALTESAVAARIARALASLEDVELPAPTAESDDDDPPELAELVGATDVDQILARWASPEPRPTSPIGRWEGALVEVPAIDGVTVVVGSSMGDAFDVAATSLLAQCVELPPDRLWIAPMPRDRTSRSALLWELPHATVPHDVDSPIDPRRVFARLRSVLADAAGPDRIVLVAEAATGSPTAADESWIIALAEGIAAIDGAQLVVVTDGGDELGVVADTSIRVERRESLREANSRRVGTVEGVGGLHAEFAALASTASSTPRLELRPYVVGRPLTALERRVERNRLQAASAPDPAITSVVTMLRDAAEVYPHGEVTPSRIERTIVPPPLPTRVDLDELFEANPGDAVPLGLVDDPGAAGVRTCWWEPGSGPLLVFGSRRSGTEQVLATILLGVIDRFAELDVRLVVIEPSASIRRGLSGIERSIRIVAPDQADELAGALDEIAAELDRQDHEHDARDRSHPERSPRLVVVIGDLVQLRRRSAGQPLGARLDDVLERAVLADSGIDVIASAAELDGAGPFATSATSRLVGASSDHQQLSALGVERPGELDGVIGRCRSFPGGELVQLAFARASTEALLDRRSTGGTG